MKIKLPYMDPKIVTEEIESFIREKTYELHSTGVVIGLSGGVDSSLTAVLASRAFEKEKDLSVFGYALPSTINAEVDLSYAKEIADRFSIAFQKVDLEPLIEAAKHTNPEAFENNYDKGNLISRLRASVLNTKGATENKIVCGTGNKDEDFGIGYYTLFGDGAVHISPIAGLSKRLVRELAEYVGVPKEIIARPATAGLETAQTDFGDLGYSYDAVEIVSEGISQGFSKQNIIEDAQKILKRDFSVYKEQYGTEKFSTVASAVDDIYRRNSSAIMKAALLHPPTPRITLRYDR
jgi:NAD+ synthase